MIQLISSVISSVILENMKEWIVSANRAGAKIFERIAYNGELTLIKEIENPTGKQKDSELKSDGPGRNNNFRGVPGHAFTPEVAPKEHDLKAFSKKVASLINREALGNKFDKLTLLADSKMLGILRPLLNKRAKALLKESLPKDLTYMSASEIKDNLEKSD